MENNLPVPIYIPPFILSPSPKYLNNEFNAMASAKDVLLADKEINTLFCAYCLSADKQWMFVSCTDKLGQISETTLIKVTYPKKYVPSSILIREHTRTTFLTILRIRTINFNTEMLSVKPCTKSF